MEVKDWERIESLFHAAQRLDAENRVTYLDDLCAGDAPLRAEVESLLAALDGREGFLSEPAFGLGMKVLSDEKAEMLVGNLCGPYQILKQLGRGGMGEVYLAEDTRLGRKVALKFLTSQLAGDNWAKRQLVKEAQAAAMLDHPNICTIHGLEEAEGHSFIAMQYVEGETLDAVIRKQPLSLEQALSYASQIVSAVAEAHAHGIIHRDIKPQNVVVTASGQVKVLDFGLAKIIQCDVVGRAGDTGTISQSGLIVGTVAYMSPEQLRAERLDFRSDIFSLGTVLYELLTRKRPFDRDSDAEVISAILSSQPPPLKHASGDIPPRLNRIVLKCLEKDKEQRYPSASELLYELNGQHSGNVLASPWWQRRMTRAAVVFMVLVLLAVFSTLTYLRLTRVPQLAVLPVINVGTNPELEPLTYGLTEDIINKLSRLSRLRVKAFTVVSGYRGRADITSQEIGRRLRVDAVLTATVVQQGEALQLQASLIDTSDGSQLWGERYSVRPDQIFELQEKVSESVAATLVPWAGEDERRLLAARPTENHKALNEYYQGRNLWEKRTKDNIHQIRDHYERAIALDASYARPHAGLADYYMQLNTPAFGNMPAGDVLKKARYMALKAVELDDRLPEAHTSLGVVKFRFEWNLPEAEKMFKRAIELKPNDPWPRYWYSQLLSVAGHSDEAIEQSRQASDFAPFSPTAKVGICRALYFARRYDSAAHCTIEMLAEDPNNMIAQYILSYTHLKREMYQDAIKILEKLYEKDKSLAAAPLGFAYGKRGEADKALKVLKDVQELARDNYSLSQERAIVYIGLGDKDKAFVWLEKSYEERFTTLIFLTTDPIYEDLRSDPRFSALARRLNLSPEGLTT
jgi:serine/threonine-protein kinase